MPGRGTPWRKGQGRKGRVAEHDIEDDSVESIDIKDLTIAEVDLSPAVTTKLNKTGGHTLQDEGTPLTQQSNLNFVGAGVTAVAGGEDTAIVTIAGGTGHVIEDEGTPLSQRPNLNFIGAGVVASDDGETTNVTIAGGGGIDRENVADPFTDFYLYDEFFYPTPSTGLDTHYEKAGTFTAPTAVTGGQVEFTTSTVANNVTRINTCGAGLASLDPTKNFRQVWRVQALQSGADIAILLGFYRDQGSKPGGTFPWSFIPADFAFFQRDGTGNWFAKISDGVTPTSTDTGVVSDQIFHVFEIRSDPVAPNIEFLIDNNIVATFTTNLPNDILASFAGVQTGATASKKIIVDSFFLFQER